MKNHSRNWNTASGLILLALFALFFSMPLMAQQTGEIAGTVTDASDGSAIAEVAIEASGTSLPGIRTTTTNETGVYRLPLLPPGNYTLVFTLPDGTTRTRATQARLQQRTTVDLPVAFGVDESALEEIIVVGSSPLLETSGSAISGAISNETFNALPVGQEYRDLIKLIPGVQFSQDTIRGPSAGGSGQDNVYQFDGVDVSTPMYGTLAAEPSTHDIDQVSVVRGGATAVGFNRSGGFKVNTISKTGSNEFHGQVSYQIQPSSLEADRNTESSSDYDEEKDWIVANFSGPIIQDKLFFYTSYYRPTVTHKNVANAYGEVPNYKSERDEFFGKLTWAPTENLLFDASYRKSDRDVTGDSVGAYEAASAAEDSETGLEILIIEGSWIINDRSSAYFRYTDYENTNLGLPATILNASPSIGTPLDLNNLDQMGKFEVPRLREGDEAWNAWAQPLIDRYGYLEDGQMKGGGIVGAATQFNQNDFMRESFEIGYDYSFNFGSTTHDLHFGYHQEEIKEYLLRSSNGWGLIEAFGGDETTDDGEPIYFQTEFFRTALTDYDTRPLDSRGESRNIEINDSINWGDWMFNIGVMFSEDKLYGQGLKKSSSSLSGWENAVGNRYLMKEVSFSEMIQPRLGVTWDFADNASVFANYARYNPSATSLPRAASWDRNVVLWETQIQFDADGNQIAIDADDSSSGKIFQEGIDPRYVDEFLVGVNWEVNDQLSTRTHVRYRKARNFWEDTNNYARTSSALGMPEGWAPAELYIPEWDDWQDEIGGGSYVIAQLDRSYTDYYEVSFEAEWNVDRWYLQGSYTWSKYEGNFDQDNTSGTNDANRYIGSSSIADYIGRQLWDNKDGTLRGDRTHLLKLYGFYDLSWNATVGAYGIYQSGQPWETWDGSVYGQGSDTIRFAEPAGSHRSSSHHQLDLNYTQNFYFGANNRYTFQVRADIYNVFDNQTGYNIDPYIDNAGYGKPRTYYNPRRVQLLAMFLF